MEKLNFVIMEKWEPCYTKLGKTQYLWIGTR